ncbi:helix-turn-helix domain-containing protein [Maritalea porphyrae]|uniref:helix-turn-helix domain-containing protein n=1 Tax=Maritalea porphyrae TaxID=880732 RepID=UPI0022AF6C56|nr:helix-turn-helix domain-containing protein [Maritalea porphyrae]MCZ4273336.1 helix-turn-helix domain-containing protein [Maritalea porphyrae]
MAKPKNPTTAFATRLVQVIEEVDKNVDLAAELGVSLRSISDYQSGKVEPRSDFLTRLHNLTNVNLTWLLTGDGLMFEAIKQEVPEAAKPHMNMKDQYVRAIAMRLAKVQEQRNKIAEPELVWWIISALHQNIVDEFDGRDVTDEELEPMLDLYIDQQAKKAGW